MIRKRAVVIGCMAAMFVGASAGAPAASAEGGYWTKCGTRVVGEALLVTTKAHAVGCKIARRVAKQYATGNHSPLGFECTHPQPEPSGEVQKGSCRREGARVKVSFGI
jgi:hypothetical protein